MSPINLNESQFDDKITLLDDPHHEESIGFKIDASGVEKKTLSVIEKGISKSYFHTRRTSKEMDQENTYHGMEENPFSLNQVSLCNNK